MFHFPKSKLKNIHFLSFHTLFSQFDINPISTRKNNALTVMVIYAVMGIYVQISFFKHTHKSVHTYIGVEELKICPRTVKYTTFFYILFEFDLSLVAYFYWVYGFRNYVTLRTGCNLNSKK